MNRTTGKEIVRAIERKRLGKFDCGVFPPLTSRRKSDARGQTRRDDNDPSACQFADETDAALRKCSVRAKRQIFPTVEKIGMFASELQSSLGRSEEHTSELQSPVHLV